MIAVAFTDESANFGRGTEGDQEIFEQYLEQEFREYSLTHSLTSNPSSLRGISTGR